MHSSILSLYSSREREQRAQNEFISCNRTVISQASFVVDEMEESINDNPRVHNELFGMPNMKSYFQFFCGIGKKKILTVILQSCRNFCFLYWFHPLSLFLCNISDGFTASSTDGKYFPLVLLSLTNNNAELLKEKISHCT